jgi:hypothetical protein
MNENPYLLALVYMLHKLNKEKIKKKREWRFFLNNFNVLTKKEPWNI